MNIDSFEKKIIDFLYDSQKGLLIDYHFGKGLDTNKLDFFYEILEEFKFFYKEKDNVPKKIVFILIGVIPALYADLPLYQGDSSKIHYNDIIYKLDTAIMMCFNPDEKDPFFNYALKDL